MDPSPLRTAASDLLALTVRLLDPNPQDRHTDATPRRAESPLCLCGHSDHYPLICCTVYLSERLSHLSALDNRWEGIPHCSRASSRRDGFLQSASIETLSPRGRDGVFETAERASIPHSSLAKSRRRQRPMVALGCCMHAAGTDWSLQAG